jgi:hypothetical protein
MSEDGLDVIVYTLVPVLFLAIVIAAVYWFYRQRKLAYFNEVLCTSFVVVLIHEAGTTDTHWWPCCGTSDDTGTLLTHSFLHSFRTLGPSANALDAPQPWAYYATLEYSFSLDSAALCLL